MNSENTKNISDVRFIALINFMLSLLFLEYAFFPAAQLWAKLAIPGAVIFWNTMNLFVYSKAIAKSSVKRETRK